MWAYWDHPHPWTPSCPLISSKGQPFLPLSKRYCMPRLLCFVCHFPCLSVIQSLREKTCPCLGTHENYLLLEIQTYSSVAPLTACCIQTLSPASLFASIHPNQVLLLPRSLSRWTCHLCVTSGFAHPKPWFFQDHIIPFKHQSYLRSILSPRLPEAIKLFIRRTSCHPALS